MGEKGSSRLLEVQRAMGDINATIARLQAQADAIQSNTKLLHAQKLELEQNSAEIDKKISNSRKELQQLETQHASLLKEVEAKQALADASFKALTGVRENLGERNKESEDLERTISTLNNRLLRFNSQIKASATKIDLLNNHLQTLRSRKEEYGNILQGVTNRLNDLKTAKQHEEKRASEAENKVTDYTALKEQRAKEIENANEVAKRATVALAEIDTQRTIAQNFASDDKALRLIEEMAKAGTVTGVYGRLADLIKVKRGDLKPVEAAAAGWLKAIVVKDMETAIYCIEVLKKTKVGRVKLIPLNGLQKPKKMLIPNQIREIVGPMTEQLEFDDLIRPAIEYVFGDTVLTTTQKSAFLASLKGIRAVAATGDLYEPGGAMETGYFRQPLDMSKLLLNGKTVSELKNTLSSLEKLTLKAREEITRINQEVLDQSKNKAQSLNLTRLTEREIETVKESLERAHKTINETAVRIEQLDREIATEQTVLEASKAMKEKLQTPLSSYESSRDSMSIRSHSTTLLEMENEHSKLTSEANDLLRQRIEAEGRMQALSSTIIAIEPTADQTKTQITGIDEQLRKLSDELLQTETELPKFEDHLKEANATRDQLSGELAGVKKKRDEYDQQLRKLEGEITEILEELDPANSKFADATASNKHMQMQIDFHLAELKELGYTEVTEVSDAELERAEKTLPVLKKELASIGGVNELASSQYDEVKENYKHLASRIYELEKEKLSIVRFMNELDRQKLDAFMKAFNQVSASFNEIFSTVTSGSGRMFLENPENPFEAGADIRLQFPGKTEMTIGSASGGEKSVGTVCFILALQAIHPMPFYMMDEIDAHLDVVNSQKLAELLKSKSKGSQFIIVSLKDVTISRADAVYGVFIQEGVSQVVGLPMQEVRTVGRAK